MLSVTACHARFTRITGRLLLRRAIPRRGVNVRGTPEPCRFTIISSTLRSSAKNASALTVLWIFTLFADTLPCDRKIGRYIRALSRAPTCEYKKNRIDIGFNLPSVIRAQLVSRKIVVKSTEILYRFCILYTSQGIPVVLNIRINFIYFACKRYRNSPILDFNWEFI